MKIRMHSLTMCRPRDSSSYAIMDAVRQPFNGLTLVAAHRGVQVVIAADPCPAIAHRCGLKWDPAAWRGMDILEFDIQLSREGAPVVVNHITEEIECAPMRTLNERSFLVDSGRLLEGIDPDVPELSLWATPESPPLLDDVLEHVRLAGMQVILCLNVPDRQAAQAAWGVVVRRHDHNGVPFHRSVLFKTTARTYSRPEDFRESFSARQANSHEEDWSFMNLILRYEAPEVGACGRDGRMPDTESFLLESLGAYAVGGMPFLVGAEVGLKQRGGVLRRLLLSRDRDIQSFRWGLLAEHRFEASESTADDADRRFQCCSIVYCGSTSVTTANVARLAASSA